MHIMIQANIVQLGYPDAPDGYISQYIHTNIFLLFLLDSTTGGTQVI